MPDTARSTGVALAASSFIRDHLTEHLTVADIADHVGYSEFHFSRIFSSVVRSSPVPYLAALRFHRAKQLLVSTDESVVDICHAVGFSSPGTFTRRFAAEVGVAPGRIRHLAQMVDDRRPPAHTMVTAPARGTLVGSVRLTEAAREVVGEDPQIWIGLFETPRPARRPLSGTLRYGEGAFSLAVPSQAPWLMAAAFARDAGAEHHFAATHFIVAAGGPPIVGDAQRDLVLDVAPDWAMPVLTALPALYEF